MVRRHESRARAWVVALACAVAWGAVACGDDDGGGGGGSGANANSADAGATSTNSGTTGAGTSGPDAGELDGGEGDAGEDDAGDEDVDHTLAPGPIAFPAPGSISELSGAGSFAFGAATAATQIEDQNVATDWYLWSSPEPDGLGEGVPIGEAVRGYSMAFEDIDLMEALGLDVYRFSVSWSRVEPARDQIDEEALDHYSRFIDALRERGIEPMVTLHHFGNPVWIDDPRDTACADGPSDVNLCGWDHPEGSQEVIAEFAEHARLLGERFGDRVDLWCTVNEAINYMLAAYGVGEFPPGKQGIFQLEAKLIPAVRNYLSGHVAAYDALKSADTIDANGDGQPASVGFSSGAIVWLPARDNAPSDDPEDLEAAEKINYMYNHLFIDAIVRGGFDPDIDQVLDEPHPEWEGKLDWLGVQYYFRTGVTGKNGLVPLLQVTPCFEAFDFGSCLEPADATHWIPDMGYEYWEPGVYVLLKDFAARWPGLPMTVTESGLATHNGRRRAEHITRSLEQIWRARQEGVDVRGYYHWSLTDNYEWAFGYAPRFGLYEVDYTTYARTPTEGAELYGRVTDGRTLTQEDRDALGGLGPMAPEPEREGGE